MLSIHSVYPSLEDIFVSYTRGWTRRRWCSELTCLKTGQTADNRAQTTDSRLANGGIGLSSVICHLESPDHSSAKAVSASSILSMWSRSGIVQVRPCSCPTPRCTKSRTVPSTASGLPPKPLAQRVDVYDNR